MTNFDLFLAPLYLLVIYMFAYNHRSRHYKGTILEPYYLPALSIHIVGGLLFGMVYQFYYRGGDTFYFYQGIEVIFKAFWENPGAAIEMLFLDGLEWTPSTARYTSQVWWFRDDNSWTVIKFGGLLSLISFANFSVLTMLFSCFSFWGSWKMFKMFAEWRPEMVRQFAIAFFFIPSVFFWGSGIMKDTVMLGALGAIVYCYYMIVFKKDRRIKYFIGLIFFSFLMLKIRSFVFFTLAPTLMLGTYVLISNKIKSAALRTFLAPFLIAIMAAGATFMINATANVNARYSLGSLEKRAHDTQWWHTRVQEIEGVEGSAYTLGAPTTSYAGMVARFPMAVNVALFRPYLWEINGPIMLQAALESLTILVLTLVTIKRTGLGGLVRYTMKDPLLAFALSFAILYAFGVGVTSYNFGALVRYKIPAIPLYITALYLLRYYANRDKNEPVLDKTE